MSATEDSMDYESKDTKSDIDVKRESPNRTRYTQKFCEKWLSIFHPWLSRCDDDANKPFCKACQTRLDCNRCHLQRHERTSKHARNLEVLISSGETAARQNVSIRQERSKYYQQRNKQNTTVSGSSDTAGMDITDDYIDDYEEEADVAEKNVSGSANSSNFQFVRAEEAPKDHYNVESDLKEEIICKKEVVMPRQQTRTKVRVKPQKKHIGAHSNSSVKKVSSNPAEVSLKGERTKMLMKIQKQRLDLLESFNEMWNSNHFSTMQQAATAEPAREKNHIDLFFESVCSTVKQLSPKLIAEAKMRVQQIVCELELRELNPVQPNVSPAVMLATDDGTVGAAYIINHPNVQGATIRNVERQLQPHQNQQQQQQAPRQHHQQIDNAAENYETLG